MQTASAKSLLIDGHVHFYDGFATSVALNAASRNFATAAERGCGGLSAGVLMLAETAREDRYSGLCELAADGGTAGNWRLHGFSEDPLVVRAQAAHAETDLLIVAGYQVISSEGLEVLTLATDKRLADGKPASDLIDAAQAADALVVLPWAVGKWLGRRGRILKGLLQNDFAAELYLGDNSGRPVFWQHPAHFRQAQRRGMRILPGSDPLPLPREVERIGSFGCALEAELGDARPSADLKRALRDRSIAWRPFGRLETSARFVRNQIGLRTGKRAS
ncbi:MAG: hypothetical protein H0W33_00055 [Gammaproteobacteria bacterium]|nr:hypothetical protein [Gammaproteobacteria bacterium]